MLVKIGTDHAQTACIFRCALTDLGFFRNHIKIDPCSVLCRKHSFCTEDDTIFVRLGKCLKDLLKSLTCEFFNCLTAPACEDLICMMVMMVMSTAALTVVVMMVLMVMIMAAATLAVMVVMMMLVLVMVVVMAAAALLVMVMMVLMLFVIMVMATAALLIMVVVMVMLMLLVIMVMTAATFVIMMMVMMLMLFLKHFLLQRYRMLHNLYQFLSVKVLNRSCDDGCIFIQAAKKLQGLLNFLLSCDICPAHDDGACILDLIVKELTEVLHVHLAFLGINNSCIAVQFDVNLILNTLYSFDNVRKFTNSGWLDEDSVRVVFGNNFFQGSTEISNQ